VHHKTVRAAIAQDTQGVPRGVCRPTRLDFYLPFLRDTRMVGLQAHLTGTPHKDRRSISRRWLRNAGWRFGSGDLIVGDGSDCFVGPIQAFADLSKKNDNFKGFNRPFLMPEGVDELQMIVIARGGELPRPAALAA